MTEKTEVINTRFSEREKQIVEQYAAACGLSRSEYLRKRALGYEPRPAMGDSFYQLYSKLCDLSVDDCRKGKSFVGIDHRHPQRTDAAKETK